MSAVLERNGHHVRVTEMRNPTYEQALTKQGVEFTYLEKVPLEQIDREKGLRNQARLLAPIDEELVVNYAQAMKGGDVFPPIVLWRSTPRSRYVPIDGNQRLEAMSRVRRKEIDAYLVQTTDQMVVDRLSWSFNNLVNGKRLSQEESLAHAVTFVRKYGLGQKEAAKEWGIPHHVLVRTIRTEEAREALERQRVKLNGEVTQERLYRLSPLLSAGEDVFAKAAEVAINSGLTGDEAEQLVQKVKRAKTTDERLTVVQEVAESDLVKARRAETKGGRVRPATGKAPRDRFLAQLEQLHWLIASFPDATCLKPAPHAFEEARDVGRDVANALISMFGLGQLLK